MSEMFFKGTRKEVTLPLIAECINPSGGKYPVHIKGRFRVIDREEQELLRQQLKDNQISLGAAIKKVIVGWDDVRDANDQPIDFNEENLDAALNNPYYFDALGDGAGIIIYSKDVMAKVKSKN